MMVRNAPQSLPALDDLTGPSALRWVAAALAREAALRTHDEQLFPASDDAAAMERAARLRHAWSTWAEEAELILTHVASDALMEERDELLRRLGRARAMLNLSPQVVDQRRQQLQRGEVRTVEEARSALRLADRR